MEDFGHCKFSYYLEFGLPARSRFGKGRCLELGYLVLRFKLAPLSFPCHQVEEFFLFDGHFTSSLLCPLMLVSDQMKNSMDH